MFRFTLASVVLLVMVSAMCAGFAVADPVKPPPANPSPAASGSANPVVTNAAPAGPDAGPPSASQPLDAFLARYDRFHDFAVGLDDLCDKNRSPLVVAAPSSETVKALARAFSGKTAALPTNDATAALADAESRAKALSNALCPELCAPQSNAAGLDVCAFAAPPLADAAVVSDWDDAQAVMAFVSTQASATLGADVASRLAALGRSLQNESPVERVVFNAAAVDLHSATPSTPTDLGTFAAQVLTTGLEALAKLVADRAKREVVEFFLDKLHDDVCLDPAHPPADASNREAHAELTEFWFPATCALTTQAPASAFGTGSAQLNALRAALMQDVRGWPGQFVGLGVGAGLGAPPKGSLFSCDKGAGQATDPRCVALTTLRAHVAERVNGWIGGQSGTEALYGIGSDIDATNRHPKDGASPAQFALYDDPLEIVGCLAATPQVAQNYRSLFDAVPGGDPVNPEKGHAATAEAILLTTAATAPACWSVFGLGLETDACIYFQAHPADGSTCDGNCSDGGDAASGCNTARKGINASQGIERLSTIARLGKKLSVASDLYSRVMALDHATSAYRTAVKNAASSPPRSTDTKPPSITLPSGSTTADVVAAQEAAARTNARLASLSITQPVTLSALAVANAGGDLAAAAADALAPLMGAALAPGLGSGDATTVDAGANTLTASEKVSRSKLILLAIRAGVDVVRDVANEDWSSAIVRVATGTQTILTDACGASCSKPLQTAVKYSGVLAAILTATDADKLAAVLDEAADPPGGWKDKQVEGRGTISITAEAGLFTAVELRHGAYGVIYNNFEKGYFQPPTLTLPVGIEFSWGTGKALSPISLYIPIVDPAAFLQYDASQNGRLPGPGVLTALSPGLGFRMGIGGTPFGIMPLVVYRPALRAWDAAVAKGADAFQIGINLDVDVTLFNLHATGANQ